MARLSRSKGARVERELVHLHHDAGVPACKDSRTGYTGPDLTIAETFSAEVKSRKTGEGFATLERWLGKCDLLFLKRDRQPPLVLLPWKTYLQLMTAYTQHKE
jgi:hypothetical protein